MTKTVEKAGAGAPIPADRESKNDCSNPCLLWKTMLIFFGIKVDVVIKIGASGKQKVICRQHESLTSVVFKSE